MSTRNESAVFSVNEIRCKHCGACVAECPVARIHGYEQIAQVSEHECLRCGHCLAVCPCDALSRDGIRLEENDDDNCEVTEATIGQLLRQRRSVRHFSPRRVTEDDWDYLVNAMHYAPSGMNARPVEAVVITNPAILAEITHQTAQLAASLVKMVQNPVGRIALGAIAGRENVARLRAAIPELHALSVQQRSGKDPILHQAPGILVLHATQSSPTGHDDCLLTAMAAMLAAPARGLGTCMIGFALIAFQQQRSLRTLIGIPENHHVYAVIAVGYAATHFRGVPDQPSIPVRWL